MKNIHWADQFAERIIHQRPKKNKYTVAAGITPSGTIHIGNFREIITVDLVAKALINKGKKVRFIYSWDDCDVFRKVPKNLPKQALLKKYLRKPLYLIPDVYEEHKDYAEHNEAEIEKYLPLMNIFPEFIQQHKKYKNHDYAEQIKIALEKTQEIKSILNEYRKSPLPKSWLPIFIFCDKCNTDKLTKLEYQGKYNVSYECECGNKKIIDFRKEGMTTLRWRIDWPMRWGYEKVDFEPAGKDHFSAGGSIETSKKIITEIYNKEPPLGFVYEWLAIKGGKQFASSLGQVITLQEMLEVYEPQIVRFLFAGSRPSAVFEISFDLDVFKIYEDFDKCERIYYGKEKLSNDKKQAYQKRIYELSHIGKMSKKLPIQPSLRHMASIVQIYEQDMNKILNYYAPKTEYNKQKVKTRAKCVINWLEKHAPDNMKFKVQSKVTKKTINSLTKKSKLALLDIAKYLKKETDEHKLYEQIYNISKKYDIKPNELFKSAYMVLINKTRGPRLSPFILEIGKQKVIKLLQQLE